jgi:hypothetical protein
MLRARSLLTVKLAVLIAMPPGVVTLICPVVAPEGTVAVICVEEFTVNVVAGTRLNPTAVVVKPVPLKLVPVMATEVPTGPEIGVNELMVGSGAVITVKFVELIAVPPGVTSLIGPVVAKVGTGATTCVAVLDVIAADTPLNVTEVAPLRFVPVMVTEVPTGPEIGENNLIVGAQCMPPTVKVAEVAVPLVFVAWIGPVVAPGGTTASISPSEITLNAAAAELKSTSVTTGFWKFDPVMMTSHPTGPMVGVNEVITGVAANAGADRPRRNKAVTAPTAAARPPTRRL